MDSGFRPAALTGVPPAKARQKRGFFSGVRCRHRISPDQLRLDRPALAVSGREHFEREPDLFGQLDRYGVERRRTGGGHGGVADDDHAEPVRNRDSAVVAGVQGAGDGVARNPGERREVEAAPDHLLEFTVGLFLRGLPALDAAVDHLDLHVVQPRVIFDSGDPVADDAARRFTDQNPDLLVPEAVQVVGGAVPGEHVVQPDRRHVEVRKVVTEHDERAVAAEYVQRGHVGFPERVDPARHQEHALHVLGPERQLGRDRIAEIEPVEQQPHVGIVRLKLLERGLSREAVDKLQPILELSGDNAQKLMKLREVLAVSETGLKGIEEMETVLGYVERLGIGLDVELDLSLARGLNYYTGAIFEVKALDFAIGSICGGGRYDDLTGIFGMPDMSGVGISFGADRIYDVMMGLGLFPEEVNFSTRVFFTNLGQEEQAAALGLLRELRDAGVAAEIYPDCGKMKKQMEYANRRGIPYVVIVGSQELEAKAATVKDMRSGEQRQVPFGELTAYFK